ncbi:hypothetical protein [Roseovarius salis]|uniref:hypothetical protein n=1 Tax=Roseovarius salis TaxID=3376063 RepID=UPI0037CC9BA1
MTDILPARARHGARVTLRSPVTAALLLVAVLAGCSDTDRSFRRATGEVNTITVGDPAEISAMVLARTMLRAGFTREEVLDKGPGIRRSLASSGGAEARRDGEIVALFSHKEGELYVTSKHSGTFVVDL